MRTITPERRQEKIARLIWTFEIEGVTLTREQAERAIDEALRKPLPEFILGKSPTHVEC